MNFVSVGLTIVLLIVIQRNEAHERIAPAKVLTNLLKVPWINLNSSWIDQVDPTCGQDILTLYENADIGELWALQMLDAATKIPAGFLTGNIRDLGMFDECVRVKGSDNPANIQGRHCMVALSMPPKFVSNAAFMLYIQRVSMYNPTANIDLSFTMSLCLPSSCGASDIEGFVNASIQDTPDLTEFEIKVVEVTCSSVETAADGFTLGTIVILSLFAVVLILLGFCTICDLVARTTPHDYSSSTMKKLSKFSLYTNVIKLADTNTDPGTMPALHGIRFLSMCSVTGMHRILSITAKPLVNLSEIYKMRDTLLAAITMSFPYAAVDTFLLISSFLTTYLFLKRMRSGAKFDVIEFYRHRYIRLLPSLAVLILFVIFVVPYLGSGPSWETLLGVTSEFCRKNWWTNFLFIQNFVNQREMCMPHTWYTAVEMQLYCISPFILYPLFRRPKLGLTILSTVTIASLIAPVVQIIFSQNAFLFNVTKKEMYNEFFDSYTITYNRALPYFVGILMGYYVVNYKRTLNKMQAAINWILVCVFISLYLWNTVFIQPNSATYNPIHEAIHVSIGRLGWSLAVGWIVYECIQGYGGPVTKVLSLPIFVPLSRLSYSTYLASAVVQVIHNANVQTAEYHSIMTALYLVWGDLALSIVAAFILNLCVEIPVIELEKLLKNKRPTRIVENPLKTKREKLLAIIRDHVKLNRSQVESDSKIENEKLKRDFWGTVSAMLNISAKQLKTPAECEKMWQDWKCDLLKNNDDQKSDANVIRNVPGQCHTRIPTLEEELLTFFAAMSCDLDDTVHSGGREIAEPVTSQTSYTSYDDQGHFRSLEIDLNTAADDMKKRKFPGSTSTGRDA